MTGIKPPLETLPGYRWYENGQSALSGDLLRGSQELDRLFLRWAEGWRAEEYSFPPFISARELQRLDYFRSFPHLVTLPLTLDLNEKNLADFLADPVTSRGEVRVTASAPVEDVLTPAACYHFYILFQDKAFEKPVYATTRAACFRRESRYLPLQRQWSFSMREIVCLGTEDEVKAFLGRFRERLDRFFESIRLPVQWKKATDPFFNPQNPKALMQRLDPVKTEMVFQDRLAIGSLNFHRNYFGETFRIQRAGEDIFSACVAFGIERWMFAFLTQFGRKVADWPLSLTGC